MLNASNSMLNIEYVIVEYKIFEYREADNTISLNYVNSYYARIPSSATLTKVD